MAIIHFEAVIGFEPWGKESDGNLTQQGGLCGVAGVY